MNVASSKAFCKIQNHKTIMRDQKTSYGSFWHNNHQMSNLLNLETTY
jgi:hypothetical protein